MKKQHMKLSFYGAAQEVTGTLYLLETEGCRILVDCGIHQGSREEAKKNHEPFPFDAKSIDAVFVTHGHMDHNGRVPLLVKRGFRGPIYCTAPTAEIAEIIWEDIVTLGKYEKKRARKENREPIPPLYEKTDVRDAVEMLKDVSYGKTFGVCGNKVKVTFHDAGHIIGSSFIEFAAEGRTVVLSGDLGNDDMPILKPTARLVKADTLIIESTYGDRLHEDAETRKTVLRDAVASVVEKKGVLMIPAFAIERTQEIILTLHRLAEAGEIPRVPIFLDSPMAIKATHVYEEYPEYYNTKSHKEFMIGHHLFSLPGFVPTKSGDQSRMINDVPAPKIIIAGSGMMTGGRIHHHLTRYLPDQNSILLIVGYQAEKTIGRQLFDGAKTVQIFGREVAVRATVKAVGAWSAHADQKKLLRWVADGEATPGQILVTHGEPAASGALAEKFKEQGIETFIPEPGQTFDLHPIGTTIHPSK